MGQSECGFWQKFLFVSAISFAAFLIHRLKKVDNPLLGRQAMGRSWALISQRASWSADDACGEEKRRYEPVRGSPRIAERQAGSSGRVVSEDV